MVMSPIGNANWSLNATAQNAAWRARALQKPSSASDLHGERQDQPNGSPHQQDKNTQAQMRHSGTAGDVPFRHAARLTAPFTAQLLGQIMPDPERRPSAAGRYAGETLRLSLGFDKRL
jgi:hypothetical protein